ncbi:MAG: complex I NDUFA9 subunit family protein [Alphaproteobacteria bacterium]
MALVTVFGGSGFIGHYLVRLLAKAGHVIKVPTRNLVKANGLKTCGYPGQIVPVLYHQTRVKDIECCLNGVDWVVNLTGILYPKGGNGFSTVHEDLTAMIMETAQRLEVKKAVHLSALGVDKASDSLYAQSKLLGEKLAAANFSGVDIIRPSLVFGAEDKFFNLFARLARFTPVLPLIGGGHTKFQPIYVGDVAEAIVRILNQPHKTGEIYELGGQNIYSFKELLTVLLKATDQHNILLPLPWALANMQAALLELLPAPLLTRDQVKLLHYDNVLSGNYKGVAELGIKPQPLEMLLPFYMDRFRKGGRFHKQEAA